MILLLVKRNLKVYMRDKGAVFFSLLGVLVIVVLYILFLGNAIEEKFQLLRNKKELVDTFIMSGVLCVSTVTTTLGAYSVLMEDEIMKRKKEFMVSPITAYEWNMGYFISVFVIGFVISILLLVSAEAYIVCEGGHMLSLKALLNVVYVLFILLLCANGFSFFIISFLHSYGAYSGMNVVVGTLVGFLTGVYIPIGALGEQMQWMVKIFPISYGGVLLRELMMTPALQEITSPETAEQIKVLKKTMGITLFIGNYEVTKGNHILIIIISAVLFVALGLCIRIKGKQ